MKDKLINLLLYAIVPMIPVAIMAIVSLWCYQKCDGNDVVPTDTLSVRVDSDRDIEMNLAVLRKTACPAVLTENLFQDNKLDVKFLLSDVGRQAILRLHAEGIIRYIKKASK